MLTKTEQTSKTHKNASSQLRSLDSSGNALTAFDHSFRQQGLPLVAGVDEAGRGPLAGPVVAAAIMLPHDFFLPEVNDSKQLTPKIREKLYDILINTKDIFYGVGVADHSIIDQINILQATIHAMKIAIDNMIEAAGVKPNLLLIDGLKFTHEIRAEKIIHGDATSFSIAAASIIAKVVRDQIMTDYHRKYPEYGFVDHKGYGTKKHLDAIKQFGPSEIHRMTFEPIKSMVLAGESIHE
jgi:ribonuclease HII